MLGILSNQLIWRSTQVAEGTPLERVQVVNSGARVQIPPSPLVFSNELPILSLNKHGTLKWEEIPRIFCSIKPKQNS